MWVLMGPVVGVMCIVKPTAGESTLVGKQNIYVTIIKQPLTKRYSRLFITLKKQPQTAVQSASQLQTLCH